MKSKVTSIVISMSMTQGVLYVAFHRTQRSPLHSFIRHEYKWLTPTNLRRLVQVASNLARLTDTHTWRNPVAYGGMALKVIYTFSC